MWALVVLTARPLVPSISVICDLLVGKELPGETERAHVGHALRIQDAVQVVALVLDHARVESFGDALYRIAILVGPRVAQLGVAGNHAAHARHREAALPVALHVAR